MVVAIIGCTALLRLLAVGFGFMGWALFLRGSLARCLCNTYV
jgi:hypothetical protein